MKRYISILLISFFAGSLSAEHHVGISVAPQATWQFDTLALTQSLPGIGGEVGFVYQYQYRALLLQTGVNLGMHTMRQGIDSLLLDANTLCHDRTDIIRATEMSIPLMAGTRLGAFYALAGFKGVLHIDNLTEQRATISTKEPDDHYFDDYNHDFLNPHDIESRGWMDHRFDLRVCAEVGASFRIATYHYSTQSQPIVQVGVFAEYGLINDLPKHYENLSSEGSVDISINHIYADHMTAPNTLDVHHLYTGIRLTLLFDSSAPSCNCLE